MVADILSNNNHHHTATTTDSPSKRIKEKNQLHKNCSSKEAHRYAKSIKETKKLLEKRKMEMLEEKKFEKVERSGLDVPGKRKTREEMKRLGNDCMRGGQKNAKTLKPFHDTMSKSSSARTVGSPAPFV